MNINVRDKKGYIALTWALDERNTKWEEMAKSLLQTGKIDINEDMESVSSYHKNEENGEIWFDYYQYSIQMESQTVVRSIVPTEANVDQEAADFEEKFGGGRRTCTWCCCRQRPEIPYT